MIYINNDIEGIYVFIQNILIKILLLLVGKHIIDVKKGVKKEPYVFCKRLQIRLPNVLKKKTF